MPAADATPAIPDVTLASLAAALTRPICALSEVAADPGLGRLGEFAALFARVQGSDQPSGQLGTIVAVVFGAAERPATAALAQSLAVHLSYPDLSSAPSTDAAVALGAELADRAVDTGADLLILAHPGARTAAAVAVSLLADVEPVKVLPRGVAATDPTAWMERAGLIRDHRRVLSPHRTDPQALLRGLADASLAAAAGFALQAAVRRTPVILDGLASHAAALTCYQLQPAAQRYWIAADRAADPAQQRAQLCLALVPVLDLGTDLGDATAGLLAVPILRAAIDRMEPAHHV